MSTFITVTSGAGALLNRTKQVQQANRQAQSQRDKDTALQGATTSQLTKKAASQARPQGGRPDTSTTNRPAAHRSAQKLEPFALTWRGVLTERTPTTYEFLTREFAAANVPVPPSIITYSGGDLLVPNAFQISSSGSLIDLPQATRYSEWRTQAKIAWFDYYGYEWTHEGFWAEELRSGDPEGTYRWTLPPAPGNRTPVGSLSHTANGSYLAVDNEGTLYITVPLPYEPVVSSATQTPSTTPPITTFYRDVYYSTVNEPFKLAGFQQYVTIDGTPQYNGLPIGAPNPYVSKPLHTFAEQPYLFMRVEGGVVSTQTATKLDNQSFAAFYASNAWPGDPGKELRSTYAGEVRIRGNQAHVLRMRYTEETGGQTNIRYEDFPFPSLTSFVVGSGSGARLQQGVSFQDHLYNLNPYSNSAELAGQLATIVNPTNYQGQPALLPDRVKPVNVSRKRIAAAAKQLSNQGDDILTPLTYFVALP